MAKIDRVDFDGPFFITIVTDVGFHTLACDGGEWRLDGQWVGQGRRNRADVLAKVLKSLEKRED